VTLSGGTQISLNDEDPNLAEFGGGIFNENGDGTSSLTLKQGTAVTYNYASSDGGGIYNCGGASLFIIDHSGARFNDPNNVVSSVACPL
jgi:hypothetical protein